MQWADRPEAMSPGRLVGSRPFSSWCFHFRSGTRALATTLSQSHPTCVNSSGPSPSRKMDDALGSCFGLEAHPALWRVPHFRTGAGMRLEHTTGHHNSAEEILGLGLDPMRVGQEVLSWVVGEAVGSAERGVEIGDGESLPWTEEAAEIQPREGNGSTPSGVCPGPGAPPRPGRRWGRGGMLKRIPTVGTLEALEVLVTILCLCPCAHTSHHPSPAGLHSTLSPPPPSGDHGGRR